jgi:hypothetical protein
MDEFLHRRGNKADDMFEVSWSKDWTVRQDAEVPLQDATDVALATPFGADEQDEHR